MLQCGGCLFNRKTNRINAASLIFSLFVLFSFCGKATSQEAATEARTDSKTADSLQTPGVIYHLGPDQSFRYDKPQAFQFLKNVPKDLASYCAGTFQKKNVLKIGAMAAMTALLVAYDQPIYEGTTKLGRRWNISRKDETKTYISAFGIPVFRGPSDFGSTLYFIGDGWTHMTIAVSFLGYGLVAGDNRALQTASQLAEGMLTTGLSTQFLKHITGRESPVVADAPGGVWRVFPNQRDYHKHVSNYDAFPSGHLATAMMTVTVIAENYPERKYIRPLGYCLLTLLSFQMMNNGVHWASDYPLALAMGYSMGKIAVKRGRKLIDRNKSADNIDNRRELLTSVRLKPLTAQQNGVSLEIVFQF